MGQMMSVLEDTLRFVSALVLLAALMGLASMLIASIRERQPEMTLLRVIGASPWYLVLLIELETLLISLSACLLGVLSLFAVLAVFQEMLASGFGLRISADLLTLANPVLLGLVIGSSLADVPESRQSALRPAPSVPPAAPAPRQTA